MSCYTFNKIESIGKTRTALGDRYLSALIAKRLVRSLRKRKFPGSNPTVGKNFHSRFALLTLSSKPMQMK